jgi:VanZ family protein
MRQLKIWGPLFLWMAVIFIASTDMGSTQHTSMIIGPFLRWVYPQVANETIDTVQAFVRKSAHVSEYAILAMLIWRALRLHKQGAYGWNWKEAGVAVLAAGLYAITDEFHQLFVATRYASPIDVLIDTAGAAAGMLLLWSIGRVFRKW